jgi:hypothetical protein
LAQSQDAQTGKLNFDIAAGEEDWAEALCIKVIRQFYTNEEEKRLTKTGKAETLFNNVL